MTLNERAILMRAHLLGMSSDRMVGFLESHLKEALKDVPEKRLKFPDPLKERAIALQYEESCDAETRHYQSFEFGAGWLASVLLELPLKGVVDLSSKEEVQSWSDKYAKKLQEDLFTHFKVWKTEEPLGLLRVCMISIRDWAIDLSLLNDKRGK